MSEPKKRFGADPATSNNLTSHVVSAEEVAQDCLKALNVFAGFRDVELTREERAYWAARAEENRLHRIEVTKWNIRARLSDPKLDPRRLP